MAHPNFQHVELYAACCSADSKSVAQAFNESARQFRNALRRDYARFRRAEDPRSKIGVMLEMEKTSFDEFILFIKNAFDSNFIL